MMSLPYMKKKHLPDTHEVKRQGGSFGQQFMTIIVKHLCRFIEGPNGSA